MAEAYTLAYYDMATITAIKSFIVPAPCVERRILDTNAGKLQS